MNRFINITACLFQPPPTTNDVEFHSNERLEWSWGDIEEYGSISSKLKMYCPKTVKPMQPQVGEKLTETSQVRPGIIQTGPRLADTKIEALKEDGGRKKKGQENGSRSKSRARRSDSQKEAIKDNPALSLPYIMIDRPDPVFTVIYFHANSEDIFKSLRLARIVGHSMKVAYFLGSQE